MVNHQTAQGAPETSTKTPGQLLAEARQRVFLTEKEVASQLRLSTHTVQALESDQYDEIGAPVYIRGYITSYCKLLGLPTDGFLKAFEACGFVRHREACASGVPIGGRPSIRLPFRWHVPVKRRWVVVGLVGLCVTLVAWWWHSESRDLQLSQGGSLPIAVPASIQSQSSMPMPARATASVPVVIAHKVQPQVKAQKTSALPKVTYQLVPVE